MDFPFFGRNQSCRFMKRRNNITGIEHHHPAALGGERVPPRASIYIHSPLQSACGLPLPRRDAHGHTHAAVSKSEIDSGFYVPLRPVAAAGRPLSDHIICPPQRGSVVRWRPRSAFSLRQKEPGAARRCGARSGQSPARTQDARRAHGDATVINLPAFLLCKSGNEITHHRRASRGAAKSRAAPMTRCCAKIYFVP